MAIQYKKIITEIMGPEAEKRGYTITSHGKLLATRPMAYFCKEVDGQSVMLFEITEYLIGPKTLFLRCQGKEIHLKYEDEESFRECINQFNEYMLKEGYEAIEKALKRPKLTDEDNSYVWGNYAEIYEKNKESLDGMSLEDAFRSIEGQIEATLDDNWESAKPRLLTIACLIVGLALDRNKSIYMEEGTTSGVFYLKRTDGIPCEESENPCRLVLMSYNKKDAYKWFYNYIIKLFTEDELKR